MLTRLKNKIYKLLRQSEKYTKTDMVYLTKGSFWTTIGEGVVTLSSFFLAIAFANFLPKEIYGQYKFILSITALLSIPTLRGLNTALVRTIAQGYEGSLIPVLKTKLKWGTLGSLAALITASYYFYQDNITLTFAFLIISIFIPFFHGLAISGGFLTGKKLFRESTRFKIILNLIAVASIIVTIFLTNNIFILLSVYFFSYTIVRLFILIYVLKKYKPNKKQDPQTINYGKHLSLTNVLGVIASNIDKILLWHYLGTAGVAIFTFAQRPVVLFKKPLKNLELLILPKLSRRSILEIKQSIPYKATIFFLLLIPMFLLYFFLAPYLYKLFFPQYLESIKFSRILALNIPLLALIPLDKTFLAHARKKEIYILQITQPLIKILLFLILIPIYGIWGVVYTILIRDIIGTIIIITLFKKIK